mmetsp:Transcript_7817/g.29299  ORF Transcript_7817/g.29299 Transcript_7817/m.29299 type:complete len:221 (-) Transcript_7817:660-1322(-)
MNLLANSFISGTKTCTSVPTVDSVTWGNQLRLVVERVRGFPRRRRRGVGEPFPVSVSNARRRVCLVIRSMRNRINRHSLVEPWRRPRRRHRRRQHRRRRGRGRAFRNRVDFAKHLGDDHEIEKIGGRRLRVDFARDVRQFLLNIGAVPGEIPGDGSIRVSSDVPKSLTRPSSAEHEGLYEGYFLFFVGKYLRRGGAKTRRRKRAEHHRQHVPSGNRLHIS